MTGEQPVSDDNSCCSPVLVYYLDILYVLDSPPLVRMRMEKVKLLILKELASRYVVKNIYRLYRLYPRDPITLSLLHTYRLFFSQTTRHSYAGGVGLE